MECGQIQRMLPAYLEGILSPEEKALVERHLTSCDPCRRSAEECRKTQEWVRNLEEVEPPPGFAQRIMAQVRKESEEKRGIIKKLFYPLHIKIPVQAAATIVIAVLAIQVYRSVEPQKGAVQPYGTTAPAVPREEPSKEVKEKVASPPAAKSPRVLEDAQGIRKARKKEELKIAAPPAPPPVETRPQEEKAPISPPSPPGAVATREAERVDAMAAGKRARMEPQAPAPASKLESASIRKAETFTLTIRAEDVATAGRVVESLLRELGAGRIERSRGEGSEIVTADLKAQRANKLLEMLSAVAEVKERNQIPELSEEFIPLRIEIIGR